MLTNLQQLMAHQGWNDATLAAEMKRRGCDVTKSTVNYWRTQQRVPRFQHALVLAKILGTDVEALV